MSESFLVFIYGGIYSHKQAFVSIILEVRALISIPEGGTMQSVVSHL